MLPSRSQVLGLAIGLAIAAIGAAHSGADAADTRGDQARGGGVTLGATADPAAAPRAPQTLDVDMREFTFQPSSIVIAVGDTVRWHNAGTMPHNAIADDGAWASKVLLGPGETFEETFSSLGTFRYTCSLHATLGQTGTVVVQASPPVNGSILPNAGSGRTPVDRWLPIAAAVALGAAGLYALRAAAQRRGPSR